MSSRRDTLLLKSMLILCAHFTGNGERAAHHILSWSSNQQCQDPVAFTSAMKAMFAVECNINTQQGIELDRVRLKLFE